MTCGPLAFVCDAAGGAVSAVSASGFDAIAQSFGEAASSLSDQLWSAVSATTTVELSTDWFRSDLAMVAAIASVMVAGLFVLQVIKGALQRDPRVLGRALTGCAIAFLGAAAAVLVTDALLALTDRLSDGVVRAAGLGDIASMGRKMAPVQLLAAGSGETPALVVVLSCLVILASVLVWAVFIVRKALIIVAAVFAPIAFGGAASDATRGWVRKWIEFTVAMVFSKLAVVVIFIVATSMVGRSGSGTDGLSTLITGVLLLMVACFSPWMLLRLVHYIGGDVAASHQTAFVSQTQSAGSMAISPARPARSSAQKILGAPGAAAALGGPVTAAAVAVPAMAAGASRAPQNIVGRVNDALPPTTGGSPADGQPPAAARRTPPPPTQERES